MRIGQHGNCVILMHMENAFFAHVLGLVPTISDPNTSYVVHMFVHFKANLFLFLAYQNILRSCQFMNKLRSIQF